MAEFKDRLEEALSIRGMKPVDLSRLTGIGEGAISQYRKGAYKATQRNLEKMAKVLQVPIPWLMGTDDQTAQKSLPQVTTSDNTVTFRAFTDIAAGYDQPASPLSDWEGATIEVPVSYLHRRPPEDYFMIRICGDSMYPHYQDGDYVLVLKSSTLDRSGQVGVMLHGEEGTIKKIEYAERENWIRLVPLNPEYMTKTISGAELEECKVIGIPKLIIRGIE